MTIEILYFPDCPNYLPVVERVQKALQEEHVSAEVKHVPVLDAAAAREVVGNHVFPGSQTISLRKPTPCRVTPSALLRLP